MKANILKAMVRIHKGAYVGRFYLDDDSGYLERVLKVNDHLGRSIPIKPSPGAKVTCGQIRYNQGKPSAISLEITNENPAIISLVTLAAGATGGTLGAAGKLTKGGQMTFAAAMDKYLEWHLANNNDKNIEKKVRACVAVFGDSNLNAIYRKDVREWISTMMDSGSGYYHIRNHVSCGRACYNWLKKEQIYEGNNPFDKHNFKAAPKDTLAIAATVDEGIIRYAVQRTDSLQLKQALMLGYYTGLRPSEVVRIKPGDFNHNELTLKVHVTKTGKFTRIIAIPSVLSVWAMTHDWTKINQNTVQNHLTALKKTNQNAFAGLAFESLRRNFASLMSTHGVTDEAIDAHMGHTGGTVLNKHYKRDPRLAVNLMRENIDRVWSDAVKLQSAK